MPLDRFNPPALHAPDGYSHVTISPAGRLAHLAGQCPVDPSDQVVPGGLLAQTDQVIANCLTALSAAGATPADVVRSVVYVVSSSPADLTDVWRRLQDSSLGPAFSTASTLLGVTALGYEGQLVEVDLTASLD
ncbi:RidA family protein [Symbioplanes lichenis]|uniref:RidA family protein n=1 Tax=Symbioplanes lichenis TaxID=1629072 RepID=UPI002738FC41|nr:RidA family protein [Actinoplanes lichenis]